MRESVPIQHAKRNRNESLCRQGGVRVATEITRQDGRADFKAQVRLAAQARFKLPGGS